MANPSRGAPVLGLIGWLVLCGAAAALGALATVEARTFYAALDRPAWAPPGGVFGPVWTALYTLMAVAAWRVWLAPGGPARSRALVWFVGQLAVNVLWSWLFFAWRTGVGAFADVLLLWMSIGLTLRAFWPLSRLAVVLMLPYLAWVSFAVALTASVWQRNPALLG